MPISTTSEYKIWWQILARCRNPADQGYEGYGGRGVTVCDRWLSFDNFLSDMGLRPAGLSVERLDNLAGYEPDNCVWATPAQQAMNKRKYRNNKTGVTGVFPKRGRFDAKIGRKWLGSFATMELAAAARAEALRDRGYSPGHGE